MPTVHRVPKYLALFVGKDGFHTPYNGQFAFVYLFAGPGAFRSGEMENYGPFVEGASGLTAKPVVWDEKANEVIEVAHDNADVKFEFPIEGKVAVEDHSSYGFGMWIRYLTAIPKRILNRP